MHVPFTSFMSQYALYVIMCAVGAEVSQTNTSELKFLFEGHEDFSTIPSYAVLPAMVHTHTLHYFVLKACSNSY